MRSWRRLSGPQREAAFGAAVTLAVHGLIAWMLATAGQGADDGLAERMLARRLCDGMRCPETPVPAARRLPDSPPGSDLGVIEAMIIPRLGMLDARKGLPKLTKYEQPERIEEAVNVRRDVDQPRETPRMDVRKKEAERDRRKPGSLADILGAPDDDDPRKRATALDRIVGNPGGSVLGSGTEASPGNLYAGKVSLAIREVFTVPPFLSDADLKRLRVRIKVTRMNETGQILQYEILETSPDPRFNAAALAALRKFVPREGGVAVLPAPDLETLGHINRRGMVVDLDGAR
ncbi:TonB C-terminal domain-containing protein [Myxococcota bacterium]|nr:TonB C-terminal domain-containing protein [Myxococcota bacterium]